MKIFADCADLPTMIELATQVQGFTTNPTLMCQAGVRDYESFALEALQKIPLPISLEVVADTFPEMERQAHKIQSWGDNAVVKIPITNTKGESSLPLIERLLDAGIWVNVTAILSGSQIHDALDRLNGRKIILSIFAGRIADAGINPLIMIPFAVNRCMATTEILWASTRELFNIRQAEKAGCHIITIPPVLLLQKNRIGKDLTAYSLETVQQFYEDAVKAGYTI